MTTPPEWSRSPCGGDFNGDHNLDLAVANWGGGTVSILLGNGDGTFKPMSTITWGGFVAAVTGGTSTTTTK